MNNWIKILIVCIITSCTDSKTTNTQSGGISHESITRLLDKDSTNIIRAGRLFNNSDSLYLYVYNTKTGRHRLFYYATNEKVFKQTFEIDAGIGSSEARFIDGNFDSVTDLEIGFESGGNYNSEIKNVFINKGDSFQQTTTQLSYPVYDFDSKEILSRYQGPNDSVITIEKYHWMGDSLVLKNVIKIPEMEYVASYGRLESK